MFNLDIELDPYDFPKELTLKRSHLEKIKGFEEAI
jgi:hypothetical protein